MTARLFVAAVPPADVVEALRRAVGAARAAGGGLRWTRPEQWHVTLAFLGPVAPSRRAELDARLARVARRHAPVPVETVGAGRFGDRVLWSAVRQRGVVGSPSGPAAAQPNPGDGVSPDAAEAGHGGSGPRLTALAVGVRRAAERAGVVGVDGVDGRALRAHLTLARVPGGRDLALAPVVELLRAQIPPLPWTVDRLHLMSSTSGDAPGVGPVYRTEASWELTGR